MFHKWRIWCETDVICEPSEQGDSWLYHALFFIDSGFSLQSRGDFRSLAALHILLVLNDVLLINSTVPWFIFYKTMLKSWLTSCAFLLSCLSEPYVTGYIPITLFPSLFLLLFKFFSPPLHFFPILSPSFLTRKITTGEDQQWRNKNGGGAGSGAAGLIWAWSSL